MSKPVRISMTLILMFKYDYKKNYKLNLYSPYTIILYFILFVHKSYLIIYNNKLNKGGTYNFIFRYLNILILYKFVVNQNVICINLLKVPQNCLRSLEKYLLNQFNVQIKNLILRKVFKIIIFLIYK